MHVHVISFLKGVLQATVDLTVHHRVHIRFPEWNVKKHAAVAVTCVMFPQDVKMFLPVIKFSISQRYADEQLYF